MKNSPRRNKVRLFNEMIDPLLSKELELDKVSKGLSNQDYFFSRKEVDKTWEFEYFDIYVENMHFQQGYVIVPIEITSDGFLHRMFLAYSQDEDIFYGSMTGGTGIQKIKKMLGEYKFAFLEEATSEIVDELLPSDFWDVRGYSN
jgi:hypothetical protein